MGDELILEVSLYKCWITITRLIDFSGIPGAAATAWAQNIIRCPAAFVFFSELAKYIVIVIVISKLQSAIRKPSAGHQLIHDRCVESECLSKRVVRRRSESEY